MYPKTENKLYRVILRNSEAIVQAATWVDGKVFRTVDEAVRAGSPIPALFGSRTIAQGYADYLNTEVGQ